MTELHLTLCFTCCNCGEPVSVTVRCLGKGPDDGVASVNVPCPTCSDINQVFFEPNGTLRYVRPFRQRLTLPEPSIN